MAVRSAAGRVWPAALRPGDVVTVVAPSGPVDADQLRRGTEIIGSWGLTVRLGDHALAVHDHLGYLAGHDQARADDFTAAWTDPHSSAVWPARGGYGAQRMIDKIDFDRLRAAGPKQLIGFSDITALHTRIGRELHQVTIHGPGAAAVEQLTDPPTVAALRQLIMAPPEPGLILVAGRAVVPGSAVGRLFGGNLSLLASDVGVEPVPTESVILVLEDVAELSHRIDRLLTQLLRAGWLDQVVGIVVGDLSGERWPELRTPIVVDRLGRLGVPLLVEGSFGHGRRNLALPLGAEARLSDGVLSLAPARVGYSGELRER